MRYAFTIIAIIGLIGGALFNEYVMKTFDLDMFSNPQKSIPHTDSYERFRTLIITDNKNTLETIDPYWNHMLKNIMKKVILENGQETTVAGGVGVSVEADAENAWGGYQGRYEIGFQGLTLSAGSDYFKEFMTFKPAEVSQAYIAPVAMKFNGYFKDNHLVMEAYTTKIEDKEELNKAKQGGDLKRADVLRDLQSVVSATNINGSAPSITTKLKSDVTDLMKDKLYGQMFQASLQTYYSAITTGTSIFKDSSGRYTTNISLGAGTLGSVPLLTSHGEFQWIYDQLILKGYSKEDSAKMVFCANIFYMSEYQQSLYQNNGNVQTKNAWTSYSNRNLMLKAGDYIEGLWNKLFNKKKYNQDQAIKAVKLFVAEQSKKKVSPLIMFSNLKSFKDTDDNNIENSETIRTVLEKLALNDNKIVDGMFSDTRVDIKDLEVSDQILAYLTIHTLEEGLSGQTFGQSNFNSMLDYIKGSLDSDYPGGVISAESYTMFNKQPVKTDIQRIVLPKNSNSTAGKAYTQYMKAMFGEATPFSTAFALSSNSSVEQANLKFNFGKAIFEYTSYISANDLTALEVNAFSSAGKNYIYAYPYMAIGNMFHDILATTASKMSSGESGVVDFSTVIYVNYLNFDTVKFKAMNPHFNSNSGTTKVALTKHSEFLYNKLGSSSIQDIDRSSQEKSINNNIEPIIISAYKDTVNGGFNLTTWSKTSIEKYDSVHYVNLWKYIYGSQTIANIERYSGKVEIDFSTLMEKYNALSSSQKSIQDLHAVSYTDLLGGGLNEEVGETP